MDTLSRYKRQLENTNSRLESELEETKKLMASRDQVSEQACTISTCTDTLYFLPKIIISFEILHNALIILFAKTNKH